MARRGEIKAQKESVFFCFPKDKEELGKWWQAIRRDEKLCNVKDAHVCSVHFEDAAFAERANATQPRILKPGAVPSIKIPSSHPLR